MQEFIKLGRKIYDTKNPREARRMVVFVLRAVLHYAGMKNLMAYFAADPLRKKLIAESPFPFEQATRSFFYKDSDFAARAKLVREHMDFLQQNLSEHYFLMLGSCHAPACEVWHDEYEGEPWTAALKFEPGQRKEGLLSLELNLGREHLYQMMFWIARDKQGQYALWIGAMQGPNMENARDIIKKITKRSFGYRTKNLILYMVQALARALGIRKIYAVTNYGYYANNHVRSDRKLKTNFEDFWTEAGGHATEDRRFYELPLVEPRKTMEEVPTRKRAVYRKRFVFLDEVDAKIEAKVRELLK